MRKFGFWGAIIGSTLAAIAMYVYLNTATIEVKAADADGFPVWSWYQAPFVILEAVVGGWSAPSSACSSVSTALASACAARPGSELPDHPPLDHEVAGVLGLAGR